MAFNLNSIALGNLIGKGLSDSQDYKQDMAETGDINFITFAPLETINITGTYITTGLVLTSDSFVLDHPVYGYLDSSILKIDGRYKMELLSSPLSFPISFGGLTVTNLLGSGLL